METSINKPKGGKYIPRNTADDCGNSKVKQEQFFAGIPIATSYGVILGNISVFCARGNSSEEAVME